MAILQAALNGTRTTDEHPAVPLTIDQIVLDAVACASAGAREVHVHTRDVTGVESLEPVTVNSVVAAVRIACGDGILVGVSTGAWMRPDLTERLELLAGWREPAYASVNVSEEGFELVMEALLSAGVGVEAGVWSVADAHALAASGYADRVTRVLVEPLDPPLDEALAIVGAIHVALDTGGVDAPRLQHTNGPATWVVLRDAVAAGRDVRIGLEDTLVLPDGSPAANNAALVAAALALGAG